MRATTTRRCAPPRAAAVPCPTAAAACRWSTCRRRGASPAGPSGRPSSGSQAASRAPRPPAMCGDGCEM
eukprot:5262435-Prymnesium_polylepis.1